MEYLVVAEVEIDGNIVDHYTSITLSQKFNSHHEFSIRLTHDVLESAGSFSLVNAQKSIGKSVLIRLQQSDASDEPAYEFMGIICEVRMEQSGKAHSDIVLLGYSPTILLENGQHLTSFYKSDLKKIVQKLTKPLEQVTCEVKINPQYKNPITYTCQYKESTFHFLNRLSADFSEFFFYDGQNLNFGKPASLKNIDVTYGEDISSMQLALRVLPMTFSNYSYNSKEDKVINYDAPTSVEGLGQYASYVLKESNNLFSEPVNQPVRQRVESKSDLENFVKKQKAAMAASLEVLTGTSFNPAVSIGSVINVKVSKFDNNEFVKEDYGKFLVTSIEHYISDNGKYYNSFEAIPSTLEVIPVTNVIVPIAEPQLATVKDNKDPDNMGRVRVQMLWQKDDEMTDWIRVMTPDAGGGKDGAKNRGLVVVPEPGDQVLICFRYNDPDRPFIMGSMFHGKTGGGGGSGNNIKSLTSKSGHTVTLDDAGSITIKDKSALNHIEVDGTNKITVTADTEIKLITGSSSITMNKDGTITISGITIIVNGTQQVAVSSGPADAPTSGVVVDPENVSAVAKTKCEVGAGSELSMGSNGKVGIAGKSELSIGSDGPVNVVGKGETSIQGAKLNLN